MDRINFFQVKNIVLSVLIFSTIFLVSFSQIYAHQEDSPVEKKPTPTCPLDENNYKLNKTELNATVSDCVTKQTIAGASVQVPSANGSPKGITNINGFVSISPIKPTDRSHSVEVSAPNYGVFTYNIVFKANTTASNSFCLRKNVSQPNDSPQTKEESKKAMQIRFGVSDNKFRNLVISGENQYGDMKDWPSKLTYYTVFDDTSENNWWQGYITLKFDVETLGQRSCTIQNLQERTGDRTWVTVIYYPKDNYCSGDQGSIRNYDKEVEALDNALSYGDTDPAIKEFIKANKYLGSIAGCSEAILSKNAFRVFSKCNLPVVKALTDYLRTWRNG